jgi:hypothetical protein
LAAVTLPKISMEPNILGQVVILLLSHLNQEKIGNGVM